MSELERLISNNEYMDELGFSNERTNERTSEFTDSFIKKNVKLFAPAFAYLFSLDSKAVY